jgi:outer membrane protein OmpA-like peptidoglycan-associated protein
MRARFVLAGLALLALCGAGRAAAEPTGSYGYLIPFGGFTIFDGDLRFPRAPLADDFNLGGRIGWQYRPWLGVEGVAGFTATGEDTVGGADVDFLHGSGNLVFSPFSGNYGGPFVSLGFGMSQLKPASGSDKLKQGNLEAAVGLNLWFTDQIGARLEARDLMWLNREKPTTVEANTWIVGGGLTVAFGGKPRDTDGDGIPDRKDKCPDTPKGATVDATGCPKDSDGDGVLDGIDQCPDTPKGATVDAHGCPHDSDADGVYDGLDQCADTPKGATVDATGCPKDSDGDGVLDGIDQCPNTPKGATVDEKGCPKDSDGDGVPDGLDKCPDTAAGLRVDVNGCPIEVMEKETELLDTGMIRLQDINFETAKADLLPESLPRLDVVGQVLSKWPELKIEIGGHTDHRGTTKYNQKLSEARAQSVTNYLVQKFNLKADQYTAKGYGESRPLVPDTTPLNMARNRRVEFVVLNKDVLKREVERRRLLEKSGGAAPPAPGTPSPEGSAPPAPAPSNPPPPSPAPADTTHR